MVRDLAADATEKRPVVLVDVSPEALAAFDDDPRVATRRADLGAASDELERAVADCELVIGAVPGPMGFDVVQRLVALGKHVVDISFFEQDAFALDAAAREAGVTVVVDAGIAPGCSNFLCGHAEATFDHVESFVFHVGGLPAERRWPWEYRAPFSPVDVLAEYTRPARTRRNGREVVRPALSGLERVEIPGLGTLEAFETDGLRTLLRTSEVPNLVEKTLRYPGHCEKVELLRETGFFSDAEVELADGRRVRPVDVSAALLFPQWRTRPGEEELVAMRVEAEGVLEGEPRRTTWTLLDRTADDGTSPMARTTGYACTAVARAVAGGTWSRPGVSPPELLGRDAACFERIFRDLEARGIVFERRDE